MAISPKDQTRGLSGIRPKDFGNNEGMIFLYKDDGPKSFWMPDTYFHLEIIFLDKDLRVVHIERNVEPHPGRNEPPKIARTPTIHCRHVFEIKSSSPLAQKIKLGDKLKLTSSQSLAEIISDTHP